VNQKNFNKPVYKKIRTTQSYLIDRMCWCIDIHIYFEINDKFNDRLYENLKATLSNNLKDKLIDEQRTLQ